MDKKITGMWIYCFLLSLALSAVAHNSNWFSPIHEYGHFLKYEEQNLVISVHWDSIIVKKITPSGLLAGFRFEVMIYCAIGLIALIKKVAIPLGWSAGCLFSVYGYARNSTDFHDFSRLYNVRIDVLYHDWDKYFFSLVLGSLAIAYIVHLFHETHAFKSS